MSNKEKPSIPEVPTFPDRESLIARIDERLKKPKIIYDADGNPERIWTSDGWVALPKS